MPRCVHGRCSAAVCIIMNGLVMSGLQAWPVPLNRLSFQLSSRQSNINSTGDIPEQRQALLSLYTATKGNGWVVSGEQTISSVASGESWSWDSSNSSYCMWPGVLCCGTAQDVLHILAGLHPGGDATVNCQDSRDVLALFLSEAGLQGMLPGDLVQLSGLRVLELDSNSGLFGTWPADLLLPQLVHLDVKDTSLSICQHTGSISTLTHNSCQLPAWLLVNPASASNPPDSNGVMCPHLVTNVSVDSQQPDAAGVATIVRLLHAENSASNHTVHYSPSFVNGFGCTCATANDLVASSSSSSNSGATTWRCEAPATSAFDEATERLVMGVVTVTLVTVLLAVSLYLLSRAGYLHRARVYLVDHLGWRLLDAGSARAAAGDAGTMTLAAKRSRFPGTPSIALAKGRGVLAVSDVLVSWVATDVEGSTQLWEWDPVVMGAAVEQHNVVLRRLLEQHGGHEVRTDGDSFTLAFHDATDAVAYCIQAQEELLDVPWPKKLLEHPYCASVRLGAVSAARNPEAAADVLSKGGIPLDQQGPLVMSGLRVRMGIGTGVPDDIFVHDLTEHVEYRGAEYDLTEDLAGIAAGGQIIMGPKTYQRWNRVFSQAPMPEADLNVQQSDGSALVDTQQESGQSGWQTGKFTRISTMGHQQSETSLQKDDSVLRRRMESFKGLFGASSKSLNAAGRASISGRKEAVEDRTPASRDRADSEIMMTGADNLLAPSSVAGTKKLTIGRSLQKAEAATAAAGSSKVNGDIAAAVPRQSNSSTTPAASASSSKALEQQRLPLQHATTTEGIKGVFQSKVPLPRSQTIGGISFAISTAASAAARHSTDNPYTRSPHTTKGSFMLQQSSADSRLPGVTAASLHVKGPAYGQMLTRRVFGKSNRADSRQSTKQDGEPIQSAQQTGSFKLPQPGPVAEGAEQGQFVFSSSKSPTQDAPLAATGTARNLLQIQGSALSMLSSVYSASSGPSVTTGGQSGAMGSQSGSKRRLSARDAAVLGRKAPAEQQVPVDEPDRHPSARRNSVTMLFRYLGSVAGAIKGGVTTDCDRQTAPYLVSATGSSLSTQPRLSCRSTKTTSSIWGSMTMKQRGVGQPRNDAKTKRSFEAANVVLLDLGYYQWRCDPVLKADLSGAEGDAQDMQLAAVAAAAEAAAAEAAQGNLLHLFQVQSQRLAPRMLLFDWPLPVTEGDDAALQQLLPGFLDAPGAASLTFQSMRELMERGGAPQPTKPEVAIAFVAPHNLKDVAALGPDISRTCQSLFTSVVREVLLAVGGYESKEVAGQVMAAFAGPRQAVEWALALQCALLQAPWPEQMAQLPSTSTVKAGEMHTSNNRYGVNAGKTSPEAASQAWPDKHLHTKRMTQTQSFDSSFYYPDELFKGIRARIGIWSGPMDRVLPHGKSGRADYLGPPANRAARMMGAAQGGQVLVEQGMMQQVLAEWESIRQGRATSALAAAAAARLAAESVDHEPGGVSSISDPASDVTGSAVAAGSTRSNRWAVADLNNSFESTLATPRRKLAHSPNSLLTSKRRTRLAKQDDGINVPSRLFDNLVDSVTVLEPDTAAMSPFSSLRWRASPQTAPWVNDPDGEDSVNAAKVLAASPQHISPASSMQRHLPGGDGPAGVAQILTITPAAYQPKGAVGGSARSTRSTGSSSGSVIVSPATKVMKGRKSLNIVVSARPSIDIMANGLPNGGLPVYDRLRQPAGIRLSMDTSRPTLSRHATADESVDTGVTTARAHRRSLNLGNQVVQTEDLYRAVEEALAGGAAYSISAARPKRHSNLAQRHRFSRDVRVGHSQPDDKPDAKQTGEPIAATGCQSQELIASAFTSSLYSTAALRPTPPAQLPPAGLAMRQTVSSATILRELRAVSGDAEACSSVADGAPLAPETLQSSVVSDKSASGDSNLAQLLPVSTFSGTLNNTRVNALSSNVASSAEGMLRLEPQLSVVVSDTEEHSSQNAAPQKQPGTELAAALAAAGRARAHTPGQKGPATTSESAHRLGQSSKDNSSSGRRLKRPAENGISQVADAVYSCMRQTGSNHGARAAGQLPSSSRSQDRRPLTPSGKAGQSQDGSTSPAVSSGGVWDAFTITIRSAVGSKAASGSGQDATAASALAAKDSLPKDSLPKEQLESSPEGSGPKRQRSDKDKAPDKPGIIAECFKITPAAASRDGSDGVDSITMIKYTALKRTAAQEAPLESDPFAPLLAAAAAAAAGVYSTTSSTTGTSLSLSSGIRLHHWAQICVNICVHKVGGFRLKGVDQLVDVVQIMPARLAGRVLMLPAAFTKGKSRCVAPASGLVAECTALLPDLSQLIEWMSAPLLAQQQAEIEDQQQQQQLDPLDQQQQQQEEEVLYGQQQAATQQAPPETGQQVHYASPEQAAELASFESSAAFVHQEGVQQNAVTAGFIVKEVPRLHKEDLHGSDSNQDLGTGAYHNGVEEQITPTEAASTPLLVVMSPLSGTSAHIIKMNGSLAGSSYHDHVSSISGGGGSANHLPNYIASASGLPNSEHQHSMGAAHVGGFDDLKGPAVLQTSSNWRGQAGANETVVASEAWSEAGDT